MRDTTYMPARRMTPRRAAILLGVQEDVSLDVSSVFF
jgi:hypothetical protein